MACMFTPVTQLLFCPLGTLLYSRFKPYNVVWGCMITSVYTQGLPPLEQSPVPWSLYHVFLEMGNMPSLTDEGIFIWRGPIQ